MLDLALIPRIVDLLIGVLKDLFRVRTLRDDCKKAGQKISEAIRELLSAHPDITRAKALLAAAEKLCPNETEDLYRAREMLGTLEAALLRKKPAPTPGRARPPKPGPARPPRKAKATRAKPASGSARPKGGDD